VDRLFSGVPAAIVSVVTVVVVVPPGPISLVVVVLVIVWLVGEAIRSSTVMETVPVEVVAVVVPESIESMLVVCVVVVGCELGVVWVDLVFVALKLLNCPFVELVTEVNSFVFVVVLQ